MSHLSLTIDPFPAAPRLAAQPLYWVKLGGPAGAESLVSIDHVSGRPPRATVTVLVGPRKGEVIPLPAGCAMREDTGAFVEG